MRALVGARGKTRRVARAAELDDVARAFGLALPIHCSVCDDRGRRPSRNVVPHVHPARIPSYQYVPVSDGVWVASPELMIAMLLGSPLFRGGYGFGAVEGNAVIDTARAFSDDGEHYRVVDLFLRRSRVAVEYKGQEAHRSSFDADARREAELVAVGVKVSSVTRANLESFEAFERYATKSLARRIRSRLGVLCSP